MASVVVRCPQCGSNEVIKRGKTDTGGQRYRCRNNVCAQGLADPACPIILAQEVENRRDFVGRKAAPRWLWQALDHRTGTVLAQSGRAQAKAA
jgi:ssDNA-binding Zn-finger/Zn-ribbon topoisomerase 1